MQVIFNDTLSHTLSEPVAIALGTFDGIHRGHQSLIHCLNKIKYKHKCAAMVYTFKQHPLNFYCRITGLPVNEPE